MKILRIASLVFLPFITLVLGWQIGASYQLRQLSAQQARITELFSMSSGSGQVVQTDPETEVDLSLFWSVWRLLQKHYVDPNKLEVRSMVFGAVSGLVNAVGDPYTLFMTPQDMKTFQKVLSGTLEGIGAQLDQRQGRVIVVAPLKGSPAEKAGLQSKDEIIAVDGKALEGMSLENAVTLIRGAKGTTVTLSILRAPKHEPFPIKVVREAIHIPSVESRVIKTQSGSIGFVALNHFGDDSMAEMKKALAAFPTTGLKGIVLDLRFNGGGYLDGAVDLVSLFQQSGDVVTVNRRDAELESHHVHGNSIIPTLPLVVLINGGSASASEIAAGALQDSKRATIIGTQSFGKGTVQEVIDLPGGSALRVTIAHWLTPGGHDLGKKGVTPDFIVDRTIDQYQRGEDPQLLAAEAWLTVHKAPPMAMSGSVKTATGSAK